MALKIDVKFEGKLTCTFKNGMSNLANFHRLKNSGLAKQQNNQIDQMQSENFILPYE